MRDAEPGVNQVLHYALGNGFGFLGVNWAGRVIISTIANSPSDERIDWCGSADNRYLRYIFLESEA